MHHLLKGITFLALIFRHALDLDDFGNGLFVISKRFDLSLEVFQGLASNVNFILDAIISLHKTLQVLVRIVFHFHHITHFQFSILSSAEYPFGGSPMSAAVSGEAISQAKKRAVVAGNR